MSSTLATKVLDKAHIAYRLQSYTLGEHPQGYGHALVEALGLNADQVYKTLMVDTGRQLAVAMVPVSARLDLKAVARALGVSNVRMADPAKAERATGYKVGGISPIGQRRPHTTLLDASALSFEEVHVSGGKQGVEIALSPHDLITLTHATVVALTH